MKQDQAKVKKLQNAIRNLAINPLKNLSNPDIESMLAYGKTGNDIRLQQCFIEMEKTMPIFGICKERRISEIVNRGWSIVPIVPNDKSLETERQKRNLENILKKSDVNNGTSITDAIKHLALYAFRGRSCVKVFWNETKKTFDFILLQNYNVVRDPLGTYYWTDNWTYDPINMKDISNEIIAVHTDNPIDYPGLMIYLRQAIGEIQWARMVEKQGIPQVVLTAPNGTTDSQFGLFAQRAMGIFEGGSGVLPFGTELNVLDSARGQDPFTPYIEHQQDLIAILSLGSTAAIFPQNSGLGSDLNSTQAKILNNLVSTDCRLIQNALSDCFSERYGFDRVRFQFNSLKGYTTKEILELVSNLKNLGMPIDNNKLMGLIDLDIFKTENTVSEEEWTPGVKQ